jgi:hypothetical protein
VNSISGRAVRRWGARGAASHKPYAYMRMPPRAAPLLRVVILPVQQQTSETESWCSVQRGCGGVVCINSCMLGIL